MNIYSGYQRCHTCHKSPTQTADLTPIPFCFSRRAATLLSTPPDIAHTTLLICLPIVLAV